jgi:hypothetical protein
MSIVLYFFFDPVRVMMWASGKSFLNNEGIVADLCNYDVCRRPRRDAPAADQDG